MTEEEEEKCWVCLRITPEDVMRLAGVIWPRDQEVAKTMGEDASALIRKAYMRDHTILCGKTRKILLAGLFYCLAEERGMVWKAGAPFREKLTQGKMADALGITTVSIGNSKKFWMWNFPDWFGKS